MWNVRIPLAALCGMALCAVAQGDVTGDVATFSGTGGVQERCIRLTPFPGAVYSKKDRETEAG